MKAKISEIFKSIQGEGIHQGITQVFVRFFGCNLNCSFCDTKLIGYQELNIEEVLEKILFYEDCNIVSLTGGEPLLQIEFLKKLIKELKRAAKIIYLETNGTLFQNLREVIEDIDIIAMDFKLPSSTQSSPTWREHCRFLKIAKSKEVFVKTVISKTTCIDDIFNAIKIIKEIKPDTAFILQPENPFEDLLEKKLKYFEDICKDRGIDAKVIAQLHKILGVK